MASQEHMMACLQQASHHALVDVIGDYERSPRILGLYYNVWPNLCFVESTHHTRNAAMLAKRGLRSETLLEHRSAIVTERALRQPLLH